MNLLSATFPRFAAAKLGATDRNQHNEVLNGPHKSRLTAHEKALRDTITNQFGWLMEQLPDNIELIYTPGAQSNGKSVAFQVLQDGIHRARPTINLPSTTVHATKNYLKHLFNVVLSLVINHEKRGRNVRADLVDELRMAYDYNKPFNPSAFNEALAGLKVHQDKLHQLYTLVGRLNTPEPGQNS